MTVSSTVGPSPTDESFYTKWQQHFYAKGKAPLVKKLLAISMGMHVTNSLSKMSGFFDAVVEGYRKDFTGPCIHLLEYLATNGPPISNFDQVFDSIPDAASDFAATFSRMYTGYYKKLITEREALSKLQAGLNEPHSVLAWSDYSPLPDTAPRAMFAGAMIKRDSQRMKRFFTPASFGSSLMFACQLIVDGFDLGVLASAIRVPENRKLLIKAVNLLSTRIPLFLQSALLLDMIVLLITYLDLLPAALADGILEVSEFEFHKTDILGLHLLVHRDSSFIPAGLSLLKRVHQIVTKFPSKSAKSSPEPPIWQMIQGEEDNIRKLYYSFEPRELTGLSTRVLAEPLFTGRNHVNFMCTLLFQACRASLHFKDAFVRSVASGSSEVSPYVYPLGIADLKKDFSPLDDRLAIAVSAIAESQEINALVALGKSRLDLDARIFIVHLMVQRATAASRKVDQEVLKAALGALALFAPSLRDADPWTKPWLLLLDAMNRVLINMKAVPPSRELASFSDIVRGPLYQAVLRQYVPSASFDPCPLLLFQVLMSLLKTTRQAFTKQQIRAETAKLWALTDLVPIHVALSRVVELFGSLKETTPELFGELVAAIPLSSPINLFLLSVLGTRHADDLKEVFSEQLIHFFVFLVRIFEFETMPDVAPLLMPFYPFERSRRMTSGSYARHHQGWALEIVGAAVTLCCTVENVAAFPPLMRVVKPWLKLAKFLSPADVLLVFRPDSPKVPDLPLQCCIVAEWLAPFLANPVLVAGLVEHLTWSGDAWVLMLSVTPDPDLIVQSIVKKLLEGRTGPFLNVIEDCYFHRKGFLGDVQSVIFLAFLLAERRAEEAFENFFAKLLPWSFPTIDPAKPFELLSGNFSALALQFAVCVTQREKFVAIFDLVDIAQVESGVILHAVGFACLHTHPFLREIFDKVFARPGELTTAIADLALKTDSPPLCLAASRVATAVPGLVDGVTRGVLPLEVLGQFELGKEGEELDFWIAAARGQATKAAPSEAAVGSAVQLGGPDVIRVIGESIPAKIDPKTVLANLAWNFDAAYVLLEKIPPELDGKVPEAPALPRGIPVASPVFRDLLVKVAV
jgi:hypothetical protein